MLRADRTTSLVDALQGLVTDRGMELKLCPGADVHLCPGLAAHVENGNAGTLNNTGRYLLLELPYHTVPEITKDEIFALKLAGITPIITHPERNALIMHDPVILQELVSMGALAQVTAMSVAGYLGEPITRSAETLLRHRLVHVIASDAHSAHSRPPGLSEAVESAAQILGNWDEAEAMVTRIPAAILAGTDPELPEPRHLSAKR